MTGTCDEDARSRAREAWSLPWDEHVRADEDGSVDDVAASLIQLSQTAACCSGVATVLCAAPVAPAQGRREPRRRGHHRTRPVSRSFILPEVTVIEPAVGRQVADVLVAGGNVVDVLRPGAGAYDGYERLEAYRGCFVMPALTDMHAHLPPHNVLGLIDLFLLLFLAHGVTTVRDAGDADGTSLPESRTGSRPAGSSARASSPPGPSSTSARRRGAGPTCFTSTGPATPTPLRGRSPCAAPGA
jgi:hypothetical protein